MVYLKILIILEEKELFDKSFEEENEAANVTEVSKFEALQDLEAEAMQVCVCVFFYFISVSMFVCMYVCRLYQPWTWT